jgi:hypothetical protein
MISQMIESASEVLDEPNEPEAFLSGSGRFEQCFARNNSPSTRAHSTGPAVPTLGRRAARVAVWPESGERIDWMELKAQDMETGHEYDRRDAARD